MLYLQVGHSHDWIQKNWLPREELVIGSKNIAHLSLVAPCKVVLPPLRIKFGVMKQLVKKGTASNIYVKKFLPVTEANLKEGIFTGPNIRELLADATFESTVNATEKVAW
jgi:hypothetical protein